MLLGRPRVSCVLRTRNSKKENVFEERADSS